MGGDKVDNCFDAVDLVLPFLLLYYSLLFAHPNVITALLHHALH